ncbi:hypothetical protein A2415_00045 [candidate division WWE3 bacterium RIFOXYC1_FULL_39_7]|uniref:Uncharacterized protein n=1 Tax=candidate division WWE3 bacterium RIFOXYC1_FULL_39_7 TaxID=1802643 RepID=A0A1F4WGF1_UNCKA|nr:MAG: hypothetical protein A2415_00045 [candidate division WWE3 bacterium RIFOXYC1_FULL_39_7]
MEPDITEKPNQELKEQEIQTEMDPVTEAIKKAYDRDGLRSATNILMEALVNDKVDAKQFCDHCLKIAQNADSFAERNARGVNERPADHAFGVALAAEMRSHALAAKLSGK